MNPILVARRKLFLPDAATGIPGLPKDVWFALGPVALRNQGDLPRYDVRGDNCTLF